MSQPPDRPASRLADIQGPGRGVVIVAHCRVLAGGTVGSPRPARIPPRRRPRRSPGTDRRRASGARGRRAGLAPAAAGRGRSGSRPNGSSTRQGRWRPTPPTRPHGAPGTGGGKRKWSEIGAIEEPHHDRPCPSRSHWSNTAKRLRPPRRPMTSGSLHSGVRRTVWTPRPVPTLPWSPGCRPPRRGVVAAQMQEVMRGRAG